MAAGHFLVSQDGNNLDILYRVAEEADGECPDDQLALKNDLEAMEAALKVLYKDDAQRLPRFRELLSLAQVGLEGANAEPKVAASALANLKQSILIIEGGARKNRYFKDLGKQAAYYGVPVLMVAFLVKYWCISRATWLPSCLVLDSDGVGLVTTFALLWGGSMIGAWLSYGMRTEALTFEELTTPEEDRLEPNVRLLFVGVLTLVIGLALYLKVIEVSVGAISSNELMHRSALALLIGVLMGISERAMTGEVAKLAGGLFKGK